MRHLTGDGRTRDGKVTGRADVVVADLRDLPRLGEFDLVWCLGDAVNYLQGESELSAAFAGVRRNLARGGIFIFDVNTLETFRTVYSSMLVKPAEHRVIILEGRGDAAVEPHGAAEVWIDRLEPTDGGWWRRVRSVHHHRHHPLEALARALRAAGMNPLGSHGSRLTGELEPEADEADHVKAVVMARG